MDSRLQTLANALATELLRENKATAETAAAINDLSPSDFRAVTVYLVGANGHLLPDTLSCLVDYLHRTYLTSDVSSMMLAARLGLVASLRMLYADNDPELAALNWALEEAVKAGQLATANVTLVAIHDKLEELQELILPKEAVDKIRQSQKRRLEGLAARPDMQPGMAQTLAHSISII